MMSPPDLPASTPLKPRKEPTIYSISSEERNASTAMNSISKASTASSNIRPFDYNPNVSQNNAKRNFGEASSSRQKDKKHEEEGEKVEKIEKIEKKVRLNPEVENKKMQIESSPTSYTGGLASLFGGDEKNKDQKQSSGHKGLSSLFGKSPGKKEEEPDDPSGSILNRLWNL